MKLLIVGGSGFIGSTLSAALQRDGHDVICAGHRRGALRCDLAKDTAQNWFERLQAVDAVINCAGLIIAKDATAMTGVHDVGARHLVAGAEQAGVSLFIHFSALGAHAKEATEYQSSKGAFELFLSDEFDGAMQTAILRPSLVVGRGGGSFSLFAGLSALPLRPLYRYIAGPVRPIHVHDVVHVVKRVLSEPERAPERLDLVGPEQMSLDDLIDKIGDWLRVKSLASLPVSPALASLTARCGIGIWTADTYGLLRQGATAPSEALQTFLRRPPMSIQRALQESPSGPSDRQAARLFFLYHPLRWSLAFLWIWTGVATLWLYPTESSLTLTHQLGMNDGWGLVAIYLGGLLDLILGLALAWAIRPIWVGAVMLCVVAGYSLLSIGLSADFWLHPFMPLVKNLPIIVATLIMMAMEADHG